MALAQAELRYWHGRDEDPLPAAERALQINRRLAEPHCVMVRVLEQQNRHEESQTRSLPKHCGWGLNSWEVNRETARLMFRRDRMSDAIRYFEKASQLIDPTFTAA